VANNQASACFHAAFGVVIQLVLPRIDLSWANIETGFLFAFLTEFSVYYDERLGVLAEAYKGQSLVETHFLLFLRHA
jgi:hypothetical protein